MMRSSRSSIVTARAARLRGTGVTASSGATLAAGLAGTGFRIDLPVLSVATAITADPAQPKALLA
jgi:hypothetical protein